MERYKENPVIQINIPTFREIDGNGPVVILGPNGSGKTRLAHKIVQSNNNAVNAISAQRRTWVDDSLPVQEEQSLRNNIRSSQDQWRQRSWQPTEEINLVLSTLIQEHTNLLTAKNQEAILKDEPLDPVRDTKLMLLQGLWGRLFPKRRLEVGGFFPKVKRLDGEGQQYQLREMSDGERTVLYMAARVLIADQPVILVDEPELHMHSKLAIQFWDEAEKLRPDCRFVYVTHDLNFALSRRRSTTLVTLPNETADAIVLDEFPSRIATEILGAATLPFYAKRVFFFEGESGKGLASEFFSVWFDDDETFAIPAGDRSSVYSAVAGLQKVGILAAEIFGLVDRDFYSDEVLKKVTKGVTVLSLHEIESVFCDDEVVASVASYLGKDAKIVLKEFHDYVKSEFKNATLNNLVSHRVRSRVGDLLNGVFEGKQVTPNFDETVANHVNKFAEIDIPCRLKAMFHEEISRVFSALNGGEVEMLMILPGKHLLNLLSNTMGFSSSAEYTGVVIKALDHRHPNKDASLETLGRKIEMAMLKYLPSRRCEIE